MMTLTANPHASQPTLSTSSSSTEQEIEKAREEANWRRVITLAHQLQQMRQGDVAIETLVNFLVGEAKLEEYMETSSNSSGSSISRRGADESGRLRLDEAKRHLVKTTGEEAKKLGVHLDSYILLGKLHYASDEYSEALRYYEKAQLDSLEEKALPARSLKIMAEAFALRATCLELSRAKTASDTDVLHSYQLAADLTILYLQTWDKSNSSQSTWSVGSGGVGSLQTARLGPILEKSVFKAPLLLLKNGLRMEAVNRYRLLLQSEECESLRDLRILASFKLAELLLHSVTDCQYKPPCLSDLHQVSSSSSLSSLRRNRKTTSSPWKPKLKSYTMAATTADHNYYFEPRTRLEEVLLLLQLCEYYARKDAVLSQSPDFFDLRSTKFRDAILAYDLTTIALSRLNHLTPLVEALERSMKFSFNEPHTWTQFGLALQSQHCFKRALLVMQCLANKKQADAGSCLCVARLCYESLHLYDEGLEWAKRALKKDQSGSDKKLGARAQVYIGIGLSMKARSIETPSDRLSTLCEAESMYASALSQDPADHLAHFYLALHHAQARNLKKAFKSINKALEMHQDHLPSLHLLILLLTAEKKYEEASELASALLQDFNDYLPLMALKLRLQESISGPLEAVLTSKEMLEYWRQAQDKHHQWPSVAVMSTTTQPSQTANQRASSALDLANNNALSSSSSNIRPTTANNATAVAALDSLSDRDSVSLQAHSITASQVERTLSELAVQAPFSGPQEPIYAQMRIWVLAAEIQLRANDIDEAVQCLNEARQLAPLSYHVMHLNGLVQMAQGDLDGAKSSFEGALGVNPSHVSSLYQLSALHSAQGCFALAEQWLRLALRFDATNEHVWALLGEVKEAQALALSTFDIEDDLEALTTTEDPLSSDIEDIHRESASLSSRDEEMKRGFKVASDCFSIATAFSATSPILPFTTVPICFE